MNDVNQQDFYLILRSMGIIEHFRSVGFQKNVHLNLNHISFGVGCQNFDGYALKVAFEI